MCFFCEVCCLLWGWGFLYLFIFYFFNIIFFFFLGGGALNQKIVPKQTSTDMFHYNTNVYECEKKRLMVM